MKQITVILALLAGAMASLSAQTNDVNANAVAGPSPVISTNQGKHYAASGDEKAAYGAYELTLGGGGFTSPKTGETQFGLDVSLSADPFEKLPCLWIGAAQNLAWEPSFAGETDVFSDYSWHIHGQLWLNTGWSVGVSYDTASSVVWHTGPEASLEYYIGDSSFLFGGVNFDLPSRGDSSFLYRFGIGLTW